MFKKKEQKPKTVFFKPKPSQAQQLETSVSSINHIVAKQVHPDAKQYDYPKEKSKGCWPWCGR